MFEHVLRTYMLNLSSGGGRAACLRSPPGGLSKCMCPVGRFTAVILPLGHRDRWRATRKQCEDSRVCCIARCFPASVSKPKFAAHSNARAWRSTCSNKCCTVVGCWGWARIPPHSGRACTYSIAILNIYIYIYMCGPLLQCGFSVFVELIWAVCRRWHAVCSIHYVPASWFACGCTCSFMCPLMLGVRYSLQPLGTAVVG